MQQDIQQAAHHCGIDPAVQPVAIQFVQAVANRLEALHEASRAPALRAVINAMEEGGPGAAQRIVDALFPEGVQA